MVTETALNCETPKRQIPVHILLTDAPREGEQSHDSRSSSMAITGSCFIPNRVGVHHASLVAFCYQHNRLTLLSWVGTQAGITCRLACPVFGQFRIQGIG